MGRLLAIDYGRKRCGIAVSDPLQIIATALETVPTESLLNFLEKYCVQEQVDSIVLGYPTHADGRELAISRDIMKFRDKLKKQFPDKELFLEDERYTSKLAQKAMVEANFKKKDRRKKENIDKISAVIILQSFMENR